MSIGLFKYNIGLTKTAGELLDFFVDIVPLEDAEAGGCHLVVVACMAHIHVQDRHCLVIARLRYFFLIYRTF